MRVRQAEREKGATRSGDSRLAFLSGQVASPDAIFSGRHVSRSTNSLANGTARGGLVARRERGRCAPRDPRVQRARPESAATAAAAARTSGGTGASALRRVLEGLGLQRRSRLRKARVCVAALSGFAREFDARASPLKSWRCRWTRVWRCDNLSACVFCHHFDVAWVRSLVLTSRPRLSPVRQRRR
jgi:hypothetical protein